ncbi:MAG: putative transcriptional regulator protein LacI family [Devosia sp.]|nr:putative transcriptional regulator protein LacI family [Devosia sp.]
MRRLERRPTIIDVARLAGVSKSTVARALSDGAEINPKTREAVLAAARTAGYERNHLAVGMRSGRSGMIGLVIPDIANPFWAEVARGAQDRAEEHGISLLVFSSNWDHDREARHLAALRQARVDGAIINPVADSFDDLDRFGLPFVLIGSSAERFPETSSVGSDIAQAVRLGLDNLVSRGHDMPYLLLGTKARIARARFLRAVYDHCIARDVDPAVLPTEDGDYTVEGGRAAMSRILARHPGGHISIFAANDLMALGAMLTAREQGLNCPDDVSILGFDGVPAGEFSWPGLTTIEKPARAIGRRAFDSLSEEIAGRADHSRIYLPCRLLERGSLADRAPVQRRREVA